MNWRRDNLVWCDAPKQMAERRNVGDCIQRTHLVKVYLAHVLSVRSRFRRRQRFVDAFHILADGRLKLEMSYDMQHIGKRAVFVMMVFVVVMGPMYFVSTDRH